MYRCGLHHLIWSLAPVGRDAVWAGTQSGPILLFDAASRAMLTEVHGHAGGVHCLSFSGDFASSGRTFVLSGGADFKLHM